MSSDHELSPHEAGPVDVGLDTHLTVAGLSKQFVGQTDACLLVEGQQFQVHSQLLAVGSAVFANLFSTAQAENTAATINQLSVAMVGHTIPDTRMVLEFLYKRSIVGLTDTPSKQLWQSVDKARPIITFAHKFDMKGILEECDTCLSKKAQEQGGRLIFSSTDATFAWGALADSCSLQKLLSNVELFMLRCVDPMFWQSESSATHQLSQACLTRILRAAQKELAATKAHFECQWSRLEAQASRQRLPSRCTCAGPDYTYPHYGFCIHCLKLPVIVDVVARESVDSSTLLSWQNTPSILHSTCETM